MLTVDGSLDASPGTAAARETKSAAAQFLSVASLPVDHPLRRLADLRELRDSASTRAEEYSERVRNLEQESRQTRQEAQAAVESLQAQCMTQVTQFLEARRVELLARLEDELPDARIDALRELRRDLRELLTDQALETIGQDFSAARETLEEGPQSLIAELGANASDEDRQRWQKYMNGLRRKRAASTTDASASAGPKPCARCLRTAPSTGTATTSAWSGQTAPTSASRAS